MFCIFLHVPALSLRHTVRPLQGGPRCPSLLRWAPATSPRHWCHWCHVAPEFINRPNFQECGGHRWSWRSPFQSRMCSPKKNKPWKAWILVGFKPNILAKLRQIKGVKILQANPWYPNLLCEKSALQIAELQLYLMQLMSLIIDSNCWCLFFPSTGLLILQLQKIPKIPFSPTRLHTATQPMGPAHGGPGTLSWYAPRPLAIGIPSPINSSPPGRVTQVLRHLAQHFLQLWPEMPVLSTYIIYIYTVYIYITPLIECVIP